MLGIIAVGVVITLIIAASVLVCSGVAHLLAHLLGGRLWAGEIITGGGIIAIFSLTIWLMTRTARRAYRKRTAQYYEIPRKPDHLRRFSPNVEETR